MKYTGTKLVELNHFLILQIYNLIVRILYKPNFSMISTLLIYNNYHTWKKYKYLDASLFNIDLLMQLKFSFVTDLSESNSS